MIGDVLLPRELRCPADHWGRTAVVCGRSTFWMENAVPDLLGVPPHAGTAFRLARPCAPGWLSQMMTDSVVTDRVPYQGSVRLRGRGATPRGPGRLGQGVAYCTSLRTPRSTPISRSVVPDPRAVPAVATRSRRLAICVRITDRHDLLEASDGGLQCHLLRHVLALLADAGGVGLLTHPLED